MRLNAKYHCEYFNVDDYLVLVGDYGYVCSWFKPEPEAREPVAAPSLRGPEPRATANTPTQG